jgi:NADPH:quinone reductase-like Zn-dependent oxidoreductase
VADAGRAGAWIPLCQAWTWPGSEAVGNEVTGFRPGDEVFGIGGRASRSTPAAQEQAGACRQTRLRTGGGVARCDVILDIGGNASAA